MSLKSYAIALNNKLISRAMNNKVGLISTLPRSGTWYTHYFFWCYEQLLRFPNKMPDLTLAASGKRTLFPHHSGIRSRSYTLDTLGLRNLYICHSACPGYINSADPLKSEWLNISEDYLYWRIGYDWGSQKLLKKDDKYLDPATNKNSKIIYLHRKPLKHFISYFFHYYLIHNNEENAPQDQAFENYLFRDGVLYSYIKQFHSFNAMAKFYPDNVLLLEFEDLVINPQKTFSEMLTWFGSNVDQDTVQKALRLCTKDNLKKLESQTGKSLSGEDISKVGEGHIKESDKKNTDSIINDDIKKRIIESFRIFNMDKLGLI